MVLAKFNIMIEEEKIWRLCYLQGVKDGSSDYSEKEWSDSDLSDLMDELDELQAEFKPPSVTLEVQNAIIKGLSKIN